MPVIGFGPRSPVAPLNREFAVLRSAAVVSAEVGAAAGAETGAATGAEPRAASDAETGAAAGAAEAGAEEGAGANERVLLLAAGGGGFFFSCPLGGRPFLPMPPFAPLAAAFFESAVLESAFL